MKKKYLLLLLLFLNPVIIYSQQRDNTWILGNWGTNPAYSIMSLTFKDSINIIAHKEVKIDIDFSNSSISDSLGNLLFFSNGKNLYDKEYKPMKGENNINVDSILHLNNGALKQNTLILPFPNKKDKYVFFYMPIDLVPLPCAKNLSMAIIDMTKNNNLGEVTLRKKIIIEDSLELGKLTATKHANGRDWWLISQKDRQNIYYKAEGWSPETYLWDATNKQIKEKAFLGHTTKYDYHPSTSLLSKITNIDGQFTTFEYDPLMRLKKTNGRFGNTTTPALTTEYTYSYGFNGTIPNNFVNTKTTISNSPMDIELEQRGYFDGLGRHLQTVKGKYSPELGNSDVAFEKTHYDAVGRVSSTLLPISGSSNLDYNQGSQSYTLNTYEASPLNRISMTTSPLGHKSTVLYGTNTAADNVKLFRPDGISTSFYAANMLYKTETRDPNTNATATPSLTKGEVTLTFKDKLGRTILVRKRYTNSASPTLTNFIDTYYVYDDRGNLVFVLPPEANGGASPLAFQYTYNCRNQLIKKQVPDAGKTEFWYDNKRDLLVATQDANGNLILTEYDDYGRVTKTGIGAIPAIDCGVPTDISIGVGVQDPIDPIDPTLIIDPLDPPVYVNSCACNVLPTAPSVIDVYTQNWYDGDGSKPIERGKLTKNKVKILNFNKNTGSSGAEIFTSQYTTGEYNYDVHGRITTITSTNPFGQTETKTSAYKNAGSDLIQNSTYNHIYKNATNNLQNTISNTMTYDNWTRNLEQTHQIDQNPAVVIAKNDYNYRGELTQKSLNYFGAATSGDKAWQTIDYQYNSEGWLTKINDPWITTAPLTDACLANGRTCATCDDKLTTTAAAAAAISKIDMVLNYNIAALNEGESPKGKVTIHSDFKLIDQEGASSLHSEESEFVIGEVAENDNTILSNQTKFSIDKIGLITAGTEDKAAFHFENILRDELAKTSLKSEAQVEILREALPIFKAQLKTINLNTLPSVPPVPGYTTKDLFKEQLYYGFSGSLASPFRVPEYNVIFQKWYGR